MTIQETGKAAEYFNDIEKEYAMIYFYYVKNIKSSQYNSLTMLNR